MANPNLKLSLTGDKEVTVIDDTRTFVLGTKLEQKFFLSSTSIPQLIDLSDLSNIKEIIVRCTNGKTFILTITIDSSSFPIVGDLFVLSYPSTAFLSSIDSITLSTTETTAHAISVTVLGASS